MAERKGLDPSQFGKTGEWFPKIMESCAAMLGTKGWLLRGWRFYFEDEVGHVVETAGYAEGFNPEDDDESEGVSSDETAY